MDTLTHTQQIDLALVKAHAASNYIRKRHMLRIAVKAGLLDAATVRAKRAEVREHKTTWLAARSLLKEG
jgi:hypothetical protein